MTWIPSDSTSPDRLVAPPPVLGQLPPPSSLLFPPPAAVQMEETDGSTAHKSCLAKRPLMAPYSEAAKALLSSPLPPELVVDFKGIKPVQPKFQSLISTDNLVFLFTNRFQRIVCHFVA